MPFEGLGNSQGNGSGGSHGGGGGGGGRGCGPGGCGGGNGGATSTITINPTPTGPTASLTDPSTGTTTPPAMPALFTPASVDQSHPLLVAQDIPGDVVAIGGIGALLGALAVWFFFLRGK